MTKIPLLDVITNRYHLDINASPFEIRDRRPGRTQAPLPRFLSDWDAIFVKNKRPRCDIYPINRYWLRLNEFRVPARCLGEYAGKRQILKSSLPGFV
jgi:hypothetical protein